MKKKKLLISTDCFLPRWDGIARFLSEIIPPLRKDFNITVIAPKFEGKGKLRKIDGVDIVRFPVSRLLKFGDISFSGFNKRKIAEIVAKHDIVFNQTIGPIGISTINAAHKLQKPIVSYVHSVEWELASKGVSSFKTLVRFFVKRLAKKLYNKCDLILVPSKEVEDLLTTNEVKKKKMVVQLGTNTLKFFPPLSKFQAKKAVGINPNSKVIGFCGRMGREKDLPTLVKAFRRLKKRHINLILLIVGGGLEIVKPDKRIVLTGPVNNAVPYLHAMDIFVLPSLTETSSLATMEAMSTGLPVVVTPVGSIREYVQDGKNGMIFPRGDVASLADKLEQLLINEQLRLSLGREARKTIVYRHQWQDTVKNIRNILVQL